MIGLRAVPCFTAEVVAAVSNRILFASPSDRNKGEFTYVHKEFARVEQKLPCPQRLLRT